MVPDLKDAGVVCRPTGVSLVVGDVQGGWDTDPLGGSKIGGERLRITLLETLRRSNLFSAESLDGGCDYKLTATIVAQKQPLLGFTMTVALGVAYMIVEKASEEEVYAGQIESVYTARLRDAISAFGRIRKANEGAVRENVTTFIHEIAQVSFGIPSYIEH
jgi:hypothetical protein